MKALIAGGSGFVGQHLTRHLEAQGHTVRIFDKKFPQHGAGYMGDIKDLELLMHAMQGMDVVYHLASNPDISKASTEPTIDFYEGTLLTQNILEAMRVTGVKNIVYFSGSGVYGENPAVSFNEDHGPMEPISTYGASKLAGEAMICAYSHMFGIDAVVFRCANIVGRGQTHGVGYDFIRRLVENPGLLTVLGDGSQKKSYIHISDVLSALDAATQDWRWFEVFNVGTDDYITVSDIAYRAINEAGHVGTQVIFGTSDRGWKGDVPVIRFDCSKLRALGWTPHHNSEQAIRKSLNELHDEITTRPTPTD